ncbi:MAG: hypothetical protein ACOY4F_14990 [Thermodesulfobacteriota bacterium]
MFSDVVFILLAVLLTLSTSAALYLGVFRAGGGGVGLGRKALAGLSSGAVSIAIWGVLYSQHYLGW